MGLGAGGEWYRLVVLQEGVPVVAHVECGIGAAGEPLVDGDELSVARVPVEETS